MSSNEDKKEQPTTKKPTIDITDDATGLYAKSPKYQVEKVDKIDPQDYGTPDEWIPRHPDLIRLTGRVPLNAEVSTPRLLEDLITPNSLHYVRSHGHVPKLTWEDHKLSIYELVKNPKEFSMDELASMESIKIPITFACDGNRRKELNMIKQSKAFNWGPGGVSTAVWTGVPLRHLLLLCGVKSRSEGAKYVCFDGSEELSKGIYGTSIPLEAAMDPQADIIIAYEMNDEKLPPDHGFPIRLIIPGFVGGRMIKWLKSIHVEDHESESWYHWHDNKVLPPFVKSGTAESEGWWYKPEFTLYEMNTMSVIVYPQHEEWLDMKDPGRKTYLTRGFAYTGGGRKIARVEITLDQGNNWSICKLKYVENPARHGQKYWTWCFWELEVDYWQFIRAKEVIVRAFDSGHNTQPEHPTWNLTGMMNNSWYRVKVDIEKAETNEPRIAFKHPVQPGSIGGGWMVPPHREPKPPEAPLWEKGIVPLTKRFTKGEVTDHNKEDDLWIIIDGRVFDVTNYIKDHPGGKWPMLINGGKDASREFHDIHNQEAIDQKEMFCIGTIVDEPCKKPFEASIVPRKWVDLKLVDKKEISPDTRYFRFEVPDKNKPIALPVGNHVLLGANIGGQFIIRPYTPVHPVSKDEERGYVEFIIKIYFAKKHPFFKKGGVFTQYLEKLKLGDKVAVKGPAGHIVYHGNGIFTVNSTYTFKVKQVSMVAGGSGLTPCYQLARSILKNPEDQTQISLLYANHTEKDILMREDLDKMAKEYKNFSVFYTVSEPPENWCYGVGHVEEEMLKDHVFPPTPLTAVFVCGPPAMIQQSLLPNLEKIGFTEENIIEF